MTNSRRTTIRRRWRKSGGLPVRPGAVPPGNRYPFWLRQMLERRLKAPTGFSGNRAGSTPCCGTGSGSGWLLSRNEAVGACSGTRCTGWRQEQRLDPARSSGALACARARRRATAGEARPEIGRSGEARRSAVRRLPSRLQCAGEAWRTAGISPATVGFQDPGVSAVHWFVRFAWRCSPRGERPRSFLKRME